MARSRDVRNAVKTALDNIGVFTETRLMSAEEYGISSSDGSAATIEPRSGRKRTIAGGTDDIVVRYDEKCLITVIVRAQDPVTRDERAEQLLNLVENAIEGQSLGGLTAPDLTYIGEWEWIKGAAPERRIRATLSYSYPQDGWGTNDASE